MKNTISVIKNYWKDSNTDLNSNNKNELLRVNPNIKFAGSSALLKNRDQQYEGNSSENSAEFKKKNITSHANLSNSTEFKKKTDTLTNNNTLSFSYRNSLPTHRNLSNINSTKEIPDKNIIRRLSTHAPARKIYAQDAIENIQSKTGQNSSCTSVKSNKKPGMVINLQRVILKSCKHNINRVSAPNINILIPTPKSKNSSIDTLPKAKEVCKISGNSLCKIPEQGVEKLFLSNANLLPNNDNLLMALVESDNKLSIKNSHHQTPRFNNSQKGNDSIDSDHVSDPKCSQHTLKSENKMPPRTKTVSLINLNKNESLVKNPTIMSFTEACKNHFDMINKAEPENYIKQDSFGGLNNLIAPITPFNDIPH